jgi:hypothetical protein
MKPALFALTLLASACGTGGEGLPTTTGSTTTGNPISPLVGTWLATVNGGNGLVVQETLVLELGGSASLSITGEGSCMGTQSFSGLVWSATATTLTVSGTPACSGQLVCNVMGQMFNVGCQQMTSTMPGAATYTLSNNDNTLTLTSVTDGGTTMTTFTRT